MASKNDNRSNILFRYAIIVFWILVLSTAIIVKLSETTVVNADKWNEKANKILLQTSEIIPPRGNILAADGSVLATNLNFYTARMDYRAEKFNAAHLREDIDELAKQLAANFPTRNERQWKRHLLAPLDKMPSKRPRAYKLLSGLSHADMELIKTMPYFKRGNRN
ncbi:MAG: hypothetical protein K2H88_00330, partial [Duncaniella sp.]|nr:hypothetical protein [Duncaniella sp.]